MEGKRENETTADPGIYFEQNTSWSPLNNTLVTQSNDCLFTFAPILPWENCCTKWKVKSWSCRFKLCLAKLPIMMSRRKIIRTGWVLPALQDWSKLHNHAHPELPLTVQTHPFMLEEENATFNVLPRTIGHFSHSHISINKVWISLLNREIRVTPIIAVSGVKCFVWRSAGSEIRPVLSMVNCLGPHRKRKEISHEVCETLGNFQFIWDSTTLVCRA